MNQSFTRLYWVFPGMLVLLGLDTGSKIWVRNKIPLYETSPLVPNFLDLTHVQNRGVSFSLFSELPDGIRIPLLVGVSLAVIAVMLYYQVRYWETLEGFTKIGLSLIIPGAVGNLLDRALYGYVTDFLHFHWFEFSFFVNNLADCLISLGVVGFLCAILTERSRKQAQGMTNSK